MTSERDWLARAIERDEVLRLREDSLRRAVTYIWNAVHMSDLGEPDAAEMHLAHARDLLVELEETPWPPR
jgi:hypothetical protein